MQWPCHSALLTPVASLTSEFMISLPKEVASSLLRLSDLSTDVVQQISEALDGLPISSNQAKDILAKIESLPDSLGLGENKASIARTIQSLHMTYAQSESKADKFLRDLSDAVVRATHQIDEQKRTKLESSVRTLLSIKSLQVAHKSALLQIAYERVFASARIITDVRPVFTEEIDGLASALIIHNLKIEYWESGEPKEFYVALDAKDIQSMLNQVERAKLKEIRLRNEIDGKLKTKLFDSSGDAQ